MSLSINIKQYKLLGIYRQIKKNVPDLTMLGNLNDILFAKVLVWSILAAIGIVASLWGGITLTAIVFGIFATKYNLVIGFLFLKVAGVVLATGLFAILTIIALAAVS